MKKKQSSPLKDILFTSISSFIVVAAWVGFNVYHTFVTTTITPELQVQIVPINPNFDMATLQELKSRKQVIPVSELANIPVQPTAAIPASPQPTTPVTTGVPNQPQPTQAQTIENNIPVTIEGE